MAVLVQKIVGILSNQVGEKKIFFGAGGTEISYFFLYIHPPCYKNIKSLEKKNHAASDVYT